MALRRGMDSHPIRIHEAAPKAVASSIVFLTAWLAGTTGYCLSILAMTVVQCIRWLSLWSGSNPSGSINVTNRTPRRPPRPKPIITRPLLSRENFERHVSFSLETRTGHDVQQPPSENTSYTTASFSSEDSTSCSSPLEDLSDFPPLKNLPPLLLDPQMPEQIQAKKRPVAANFPIKARNPFKFRRASTSSAPSPAPAISEVLPECSSIDRPPASPVEPASRKPSLIKRLSMKGRRACSVNAAIGSPSSAPTSPKLPPSSFRDAANSSRRSASVDIPTQISYFPVLAPHPPSQSSPRRTLLGGFTRRPRTTSLSAVPARTQPYGPPYNCPLPVPQPRRSGGARRSTASTQIQTPTG